MRCSLAVWLFLPVVSLADDDLSVLPAKGDMPPNKMLHAYLIDQCQKHFDARREAIAAIKTAGDVDKRREQLRSKFVEALGGYPEKTPLNAQVVGKLERDGYRIEKIVFESRPNHHVTANLYLPEGKGPFPAVLMPLGHWDEGKSAPEMQRGAILLATHGMAAFIYDPIGQGERKQLLDDKGKAFIPSQTNEHTLIGIGALLVGRCAATYRIWDGIRAIDYLVSRPEVDAKKIGCTGCSGGGTMTSYLMALDARVYAAAPSCFITSLERLFATIGPQDAEQNITGQVAFGMNHADYLLMRAPKPTLMCVATEDFFDIQGAWATFREAKQLYSRLGYSERIEIVEADTEHGYSKTHREAMARFMSRWLLGKDEPIVEGGFEINKAADLRCTRTGQVLEEFKGKSCFDMNRERAAELAKQRAKQINRPGHLRADVASLIGVNLPISAAVVKKMGTVKRADYEIRKLLFETEPGIAVPALLFQKGEKAKGPLVVYLYGQGKSADAAPGGPIEKLVLAGNRVLAVDPRGMGETAISPLPRPNYFGADFKESFLSLHLNKPLLGQRVADVLAVINQSAKDSGGEIHLIGIGAAAPIALHVAALEPRITETTIENGLVSWQAALSTPAKCNQLDLAVPRALTVYDFPDLAALVAPRKLTIRSAVDAAGKPVSQEALESEYSEAKRAFKELKRDENLRLIAR